MSATDVLRRLYEALSAGDIPALVECIDPDVIVDEPAQLPYGGVHHGRTAFLQTVWGG